MGSRWWPSGRAGALPEEYDDRPDVRVPAGVLQGSDVRRVRFSLAFRGYRMSEVDTLLARLADQLDARRRPSPATDAATETEPTARPTRRSTRGPRASHGGQDVD